MPTQVNPNRPIGQISGKLGKNHSGTLSRQHHHRKEMHSVRDSNVPAGTSPHEICPGQVGFSSFFYPYCMKNFPYFPVLHASFTGNGDIFSLHGGLVGPHRFASRLILRLEKFTVTNYHQIFHLCWVILASEILSCGLSGVYPPFVKWAENFSGGWRGFSSGADSINSSRELLEKTYKYCPWIPSNIEIVSRFNYSSLISPEIKGFSINTNPPKKTF